MSEEDKDQSFKSLEERWVNHMDPLQIWGKHNHVVRALQRSCWEGARSLGRLKWNEAPEWGRKVIVFLLFPHASPAAMFAWGTWSCGVAGLLSFACCPRCLSAAGIKKTFNLDSIYTNTWLVLGHCSLQGIKALSINLSWTKPHLFLSWIYRRKRLFLVEWSVFIPHFFSHYWKPQSLACKAAAPGC